VRRAETTWHQWHGWGVPNPELGHAGEAMVRRVYGHLGQVRHRAEAVEYRAEQPVAKLGTAPP